MYGIDDENTQQDIYEVLQKEMENDEKEWDENKLLRLKLVLFSMAVASGFLATYTPQSFYMMVLFTLHLSVRPIFIYPNWMGFVYEATKTDAIIMLIHGIVISQHEEDLVGEEEQYRMLQEILRSPELYKNLCGSCLKGATDPSLDKLSDEKKKKLAHIEKFEQKGFEVASLKHKLLGTNTTKANAADQAVDL